jgi:hypothetical protein
LSEIVSRDHEHGIRYGVGDIDNLKETTSLGLAERDARAIASRPVLDRRFEDLLYLLLLDAMPQAVRLTIGVDVKTQVHSTNLGVTNDEAVVTWVSYGSVDSNR